MLNIAYMSSPGPGGRWERDRIWVNVRLEIIILAYLVLESDYYTIFGPTCFDNVNLKIVKVDNLENMESTLCPSNPFPSCQ